MEQEVKQLFALHMKIYLERNLQGCLHSHLDLSMKWSSVDIKRHFTPLKDTKRVLTPTKVHPHTTSKASPPPSFWIVVFKRLQILISGDLTWLLTSMKYKRVLVLIKMDPHINYDINLWCTHTHLYTLYNTNNNNNITIAFSEELKLVKQWLNTKQRNH